MKHENDRLVFSPSDLTRHMESPFASWMQRLAIENPAKVPHRDPEDAVMTLLQKRGYEHEDRFEAQLRADGRPVSKISGKNSEEKHLATIEAMKAGVDVICQAHLKKDSFAGYADFLIKVEGKSDLGDYHYEVWDTKLATTVKPYFLVQLCCYSEMLEPLQGILPGRIAVVLGNNAVESFPTIDFIHYYKSLKRKFIAEQLAFDENNMPDPALSKSHGNWSEHVAKLLSEQNHLSLVANITKGQIAKLNRVGVHTVRELANCTETTIKGVREEILSRLRQQAQLQMEAKPDQRPPYEILEHEPEKRTGLALLPPVNPADIFFDIEGNPLDGDGMEYLWGVTYYDEAKERQFLDFWAHDEAQEKAAFEAFIDWTYARWKASPGMHIYHYAPYEITACRRLMGKYATREDEVDQLLRNEVFVDLYKVVRGGLRLGEPKYSIKNVEKLYRSKRDTDVATGIESVVVYEQWKTLFDTGETGDTWQSSPILNSIRDYNIDDCESTQELCDWLRERQSDAGVVFLGKKEVVEAPLPDWLQEIKNLQTELLDKSEACSEANQSTSDILFDMAMLLDFHRREDKPKFWRLFDRLGMTEEELYDDFECLSGCVRTDRPEFKSNPDKDRVNTVEYRFDPNQEYKGVAKSMYVIDIENKNGNQLSIPVAEKESNYDDGLICFKVGLDLPKRISLIPDENISTSVMRNSIRRTAELLRDASLPESAIMSFLKRERPNFRTDRPGDIANESTPSANLKKIVSAALDLDRSYLAIQGPPGSGKTYTAKHIIAKILKNGGKVGISSNSHKAINHLLTQAAQLCSDEGIGARFACAKNTGPEIDDLGILVGSNDSLHKVTTDTCCIGATAWAFSRTSFEGTLDYLFIDEAGQVPVANLVAMSPAAKNIILLGDQMQLSQPTQGSHPGRSGYSILQYLLNDRPTIADNMGVFLHTSFRMHPEINSFISNYVYEGKLRTAKGNEKRLIALDSSVTHRPSAGIVYVPIQHEGNTQGSDEEVAEIASIVQQLLSYKVIRDNGDSSPIKHADILIVAPYNLQVRKLKSELGENAKVGTVDKFQGQEAAVVIISMCASDASESPRGIDFLFSQNRINVAVSRAQTLTIVVGHPSLASTNAGNIKQMKQINLIAALQNH